jgi:hypothetical protein
MPPATEEQYDEANDIVPFIVSVSRGDEDRVAQTNAAASM